MGVPKQVGYINNTTINVSNIDKIIKTCKEMLLDRCCTTVEISENISETIDNIQPVLMGFGNKRINVFFHSDDRVGVKFLRMISELPQVDTNIIISLEGPTTFTRKEAENEMKNIQFFTYRELTVNITKHDIVPKHELVIDSCQYNKHELPKILVTDPIIKYYNFPVGSIIKCVRKLGAHEPLAYYRVVVPA